MVSQLSGESRGGGPVEGDSHARPGAAMADIYFYQVQQGEVDTNQQTGWKDQADSFIKYGYKFLEGWQLLNPGPDPIPHTAM